MYLGSQAVYTRMQFYRPRFNIYLTASVHNILLYYLLFFLVHRSENYMKIINPFILFEIKTSDSIYFRSRPILVKLSIKHYVV